MIVINRNSRSTAYFFLIITSLAWGSLYVVSKYVMAYVPPLTVLLARYVFASVVLLPFLKFRKSRTSEKTKIDRKDYKYIFFIGAVGYFVSFGLQMVGTKLSNATLASLINSLSPIFTIVFAVPFLKEKITWVKIVSVAAAIIGAYIIVGTGSSGNVAAGIALEFVSVIIWSLTSIIVKRVTEKYDPLTITAYSMLVAFICTIPFSAYELATTRNVQIFTPQILAGLAYLGIVCTALATVLWNQSLSMIEAGYCSLFYSTQPMVAALLGSIFLGEVIRLPIIIGAAFILGGVLFSVLFRKATEQHA